MTVNRTSHSVRTGLSREGADKIDRLAYENMPPGPTEHNSDWLTRKRRIDPTLDARDIQTEA